MAYVKVGIVKTSLISRVVCKVIGAIPSTQWQWGSTQWQWGNLSSPRTVSTQWQFINTQWQWGGLPSQHISAQWQFTSTQWQWSNK